MGDTAARPDRPRACQRRRRSGGELSVMGDDAGLYRPCWDCGRRTGAWCNGGTATGRCSAVAVFASVTLADTLRTRKTLADTLLTRV